MSEAESSASFITSRIVEFGDACVRCDLEFQPEVYSDQLFTKLDVLFSPRLRRATAKRKSEYLAGRVAALNCIDSMQRSITRRPFKLDSGDHLAPVWPQGLTGSISHSNGKASAIVGCRDQYAGLGLDVENWIKPELYHRIRLQILTKEEESLSDWIGMSKNVRGTIVFSAKESLFKALYPLVNEYFDFLDARLMEVSLADSRLTFRLMRTLGGDSQVSEGTLVNVVFTAKNEHVMTETHIARDQLEARLEKICVYS